MTLVEKIAITEIAGFLADETATLDEPSERAKMGLERRASAILKRLKELGYRNLSDPNICEIDPDAELPKTTRWGRGTEAHMAYNIGIGEMLKAGWVKKK